MYRSSLIPATLAIVPFALLWPLSAQKRRASAQGRRVRGELRGRRLAGAGRGAAGAGATRGLARRGAARAAAMAPVAQHGTQAAVLAAVAGATSAHTVARRRPAPHSPAGGGHGGEGEQAEG